MITKFRAERDKVVEVQIAKETDKYVVLLNGVRELKASDVHCYSPHLYTNTYQEAKDWAIATARKKVASKWHEVNYRVDDLLKTLSALGAPASVSLVVRWKEEADTILKKITGDAPGCSF